MANTHRDAQNQPNRTPINYFPDIEQQTRQLLLLNQTINQHILQIKHGDTWHSDTDHHSKLGATVMNKQSYLEGGNTWVNTGNTATREIDLCFKAMKTKTFTRVALIIEENEQNNNNAREHAAKHPETHMYTINTYKPNSATYKQEGTKNPWTLGKTRTNTKTLKLLMIQNRPETTQSLRRLKTQIKKTDGDNHDTPRQYDRNDYYQYPSLTFYRNTPKIPTNYVDKEDLIAHALGILPADIASRLNHAGHKNLVMDKELKNKILRNLFKLADSVQKAECSTFLFFCQIKENVAHFPFSARFRLSVEKSKMCTFFFLLIHVL